MLILCLDFINSLWYEDKDLSKDPLSSVSQAVAFCQKWAISEEPVPVGQLDFLISARLFLNEVTNELCQNKTISQKNLDRLNQYLHALIYCESVQKNPDGLLVFREFENPEMCALAYAVFSSFTQLITGASLERLKKCENNDCGWFFYDESKSHTRKWCSNRCASLIKVRRFRSALNH